MRKLLFILAPAALLAAGCGGSGPTTTARGSQSNNPVQAAYRYSACMRQHGVTDFPDPQVVNNNGEHGIKIAIHAGEANSPSFNSAQKACQGILPEPQNETAAQRQARAQGLVSFARCMRAHGVTSFPDPTAQGRISRETLAAAGVDIHSPAVIQDAYACVPASRGQLTRADIAQAENGS
jgi:hypothetical protein